ncbi:hypothetical protein BofuT4_uP007060.1 [Botrytis cinerea T4]|uniref:Uncharacterized protein n=1 Tax=Botryotinia fuckeliana (strain T4) TaxID=999810 RepID=G2Y4F7_BOTF4|nr:hypothetical protein BofuT4_uP007060.1 [Botrytis cinerea T4]
MPIELLLCDSLSELALTCFVHGERNIKRVEKAYEACSLCSYFMIMQITLPKSTTRT